MKLLKNKSNENDAELFLVWVTASPEICYERMKKRNSVRDTEKLKNWDEYVKKINFTPPFELKNNGAVDKFIIFDANNEENVKKSLSEVLKLLQEDKNAKQRRNY